LVPRGVEYTFTVVVSFHPFFITRVDRAYRVRCFYTETEKLVESQLEVSTLTTHQVNEQRQMPSCLYTLRRDSPDGPLVRYASVGDKIFHVWQCNGSDRPFRIFCRVVIMKVRIFPGNPTVYDILIKNCNVDDGQGTKVQIIDDKGCTTDLRLVSNVQYRAKALSAYTQSSVFKFADKAEVNFQCSIEICLREEDGCERITPPHCSGENENIMAEIPSFSGDLLGPNRTMQQETGLPYNSASVPRFHFRHSSALPFPMKSPMGRSTIFPSREVITRKSNRLATPSISSKLPNGEGIRFSLPLRQHDEPMGRDLFKESTGLDMSALNSTGQKITVSAQENITEHSKITKRETNSSFYHSSQGRPMSYETDITAEPLVILPLNDENQDRQENSVEVEQMLKSGCKEQDVKYSFSVDYALIIAFCGTLLAVSVALAFLFHRIRRSQKISLTS
ncbi:zona pellucida-like domain protein, partial [Trichuris suis]